MQLRLSKIDVVWSYLAYIFNACTNIILLPMILKSLSTIELGLWYIFMGIGTLANLLDFGFTPTMTRNVTYCWSGATTIKKEGLDEPPMSGQPNFSLLNTVIRTCRRIYLIISLIALALLSTGGTLYVIKVTESTISNEYLVSWAIFCIAIFLNIYYGYWAPFLRGVGAIKESQKAVIISRSIQIVVAFIGLYLGFGLIAVTVAYLFSGVILRQVSKSYFFSYKNIKENIGVNGKDLDESATRRIFTAIWPNSWRLGLVFLGAFMINQANLMISSLYLGIEFTASYGLTLQLFSVINTFALILFNTQQPLLSAARLNRDEASVKHYFSFSLTIAWFSFIIGAVLLILLGEDVLSLLKSNTALLPQSMLLFIGLYLFLEFNHSTFATFITISNSVPFVKASILSGIAIVTLSLLLINYTTLGAWGLLISQFIVQLMYNNWKWPQYVMKDLNMRLMDIPKIAVSRKTGVR